jgi:hypothetical protein
MCFIGVRVSSRRLSRSPSSACPTEQSTSDAADEHRILRIFWRTGLDADMGYLLEDARKFLSEPRDCQWKPARIRSDLFRWYDSSAVSRRHGEIIHTSCGLPLRRDRSLPAACAQNFQGLVERDVECVLADLASVCVPKNPVEFIGRPCCTCRLRCGRRHRCCWRAPTLLEKTKIAQSASGSRRGEYPPAPDLYKFYYQTGSSRQMPVATALVDQSTIPVDLDVVAVQLPFILMRFPHSGSAAMRSGSLIGNQRAARLRALALI